MKGKYREIRRDLTGKEERKKEWRDVGRTCILTDFIDRLRFWQMTCTPGENLYVFFPLSFSRNQCRMASSSDSYRTLDRIFLVNLVLPSYFPFLSYSVSLVILFLSSLEDCYIHTNQLADFFTPLILSSSLFIYSGNQGGNKRRLKYIIRDINFPI